MLVPCHLKEDSATVSHCLTKDNSLLPKCLDSQEALANGVYIFRASLNRQKFIIVCLPSLYTLCLPTLVRSFRLMP
jgi:hypothetical protein